ncbi:MAG: response regulator [Halobacteriaceae archaeon]
MGEGIRVLHVDDEPAFLELASELLERADDRIEVVTAASGPRALEVLAAEPVDCVVSDYQMPEMDGLALLEAVRRDHGDLPFVLFTGRGSEDVASDAISAGATDYLQKGSGSERYELLANRVTNAVESHRAVARAQTLERIRDIVRTVNQALVRATSREEIERRVCEIISDADPYRFAWMGEVDEAVQRVIPREWAGVDSGYLEDVTITTDRSATGQGPAGRAVRQRRVSVTQDVQSDESFEPWRERAAERGFQSVAAVPLTHGEDIYGLLGVYADRPDAFDETEIGILEELGADVGHALHAHAARETLIVFKEDIYR